MPDLLTEGETALALRMARSTLMSWRSRGEGPAFVKAGSRVFYTPQAIADWIEHRTRTPDRISA